MKKTTKPIKYLLVTVFSLVAIGTVAMTACDKSRTPDFNPTQLSAPENVYLCHNQMLDDTTEYILKWDKVKGAKGYEIKFFNKTLETNKNYYDVSFFIETDKETKFQINAIGDEKNYADSESVFLAATPEVITEKLIYTKRPDGRYEVAAKKTITQERLSFPDSYNGRDVIKINGNGTWGENVTVASIRFPQRLITIGERAFYHFEKLENVFMPNTVTTIEDSAFSGSTSLETIKFSNNLKSMGDFAFNKTPIKNLVLPNGITKLGRACFSFCRNLTNVSFPVSLTAIPFECFRGCESFLTLTIPKHIQVIEQSAFYNCKNLKTLNFESGSSLKECGIETFGKCDKLFYINIPDGLTVIGERMFYDCDSLTKINIPDSLQTIEPFAFDNCDNLTSIHIPKGVTDLQGAALFNKAFTSFSVAEDNSSYKAVNGNIYSKDGTELVQYAYNNSSTEFTVPDGVTKIGDYAFYEATNLLTVHLPEGILEIGDYSFCNCAITEIDLPYGLTTIGEYAFACINNGQTNLTEIELPDSVTLFKQGAFNSNKITKIVLSKGLTQLIAGAFESKVLSVLELPSEITIKEQALWFSNIEQLILPKDLKKCEGVLFAGLFSLTIPDIFYKGSPLEWALLKGRGVYNDDTFSGELNGKTYYATVYFYSESEPPLNSDGTAYRDNYWHYAEDGITPVVWEL